MLDSTTPVWSLVLKALELMCDACSQANKIIAMRLIRVRGRVCQAFEVRSSSTNHGLRF